MAASSLMIVLLLTSCKDDKKTAPKPEPPDEEPADTFNYVYKEGTSGYQVYRIPAIVKTKQGSLLAFAEARKLRSNGDSGDIDLVVKKSTDGGETWGNMIMVWNEGMNTAGNPVPIVDQQTGRIHLLMTWNHGDDTWGELTKGTGNDTRRVFYTWSDDEGATWKEPLEITGSVKASSWDWYGTGPVHGIQIRNGAKKNRLVVPSYYTERVNGQRKDYSHVIYSDDNGQTWKAGNAAPYSPVGECTVTELEDGKLLLNMRTSAGTARKYCISDDGGETWGEVKTDYTLIDPQCQGSLLSGTFNGAHTIFFANAASAERKNMTVKISLDNGKTWAKKVTVHEGPSAYSDLVQLDEKTIGLFYEGGIGRPYEGLAFKVINLNDFK